MTATELPAAGTEERVDALLRVADDLAHRSTRQPTNPPLTPPRGRRRALPFALVTTCVILGPALLAIVGGSNGNAGPTSARANALTAGLVTAAAGPAAGGTATPLPSASSSSPLLLLLLLPSGRALDDVGPTSSTTSVATTTTTTATTATTTVDPSAVAATVPDPNIDNPSGTDQSVADESPPPDDTSDAPAPEPTPQPAPRSTRPPTPRTTAPAPAPTEAPPPPTPAPAPAPTPAPTNPPPVHLSVTGDQVSVKAGTASTVHPLSNDTGVAASTLRLTRLPADVQAQTDGSGGVQISADKSLKGETRSIGYLVCDASGNTCGGTTITVAFT